MCHLGANINFLHPNVPVSVNPHYLLPGYLGKDQGIFDFKPLSTVADLGGALNPPLGWT